MLTAADIMTNEVCTIDSSASVADAIALMQTQKVRSLIVNRRSAEMPFGIVTERDIVYKVIARDHDPERVIVQDVMRQPCVAIEPDLSIREIAQVFSDAGIQRAPVIKDGELQGVVSVTDVVMRGTVAVSNQHELAQRIAEAVRHARAICQEKGQISKECAIAWETVEELQAEAAHRRIRPQRV